MKTNGEVDVYTHVFPTAALTGVVSFPDALPQGKSACIHRVGGWVCPRFGMDDLADFNSDPSGLPARNQSLCRLRPAPN